MHIACAKADRSNPRNSGFQIWFLFMGAFIVRYILLFTACLVLFSGCSGGSSGGDPETDLMMISILYAMHISRNGAPPANMEQLVEFEEKWTRDSAATGYHTALHSGNYVINWSVDTSEESPAGGTTVLAYQKDTPETGGFVAFADGDIRKLSAAEFAEVNK